MAGTADAVRIVNSLVWANLVVWNPAGEIHIPGTYSSHASQEVFRLLLIMRIAQRTGMKTLIENHSLEIGAYVLRVLLGHVYRKSEAITVRDRSSLENALSWV